MSCSEGRDDSGFTVVELSVVLLLAALVMTSVLGVLQSQTRAEQRISAVATNQELVRQTLVQLQRDLRSAEPLLELANSAAFARQVELLHVDFVTGEETRVRWRLDAAAGEIVRELVDATTGTATGTTHRLRGVAGSTIFAYYGSSGDEFPAGATAAATIAMCTTRVRVTIAAAPERGPTPLRLSSDVQLRNRRTSEALCG